MRRVTTLMLALSLVGSTVAFVQPGPGPSGTLPCGGPGQPPCGQPGHPPGGPPPGGPPQGGQYGPPPGVQPGGPPPIMPPHPRWSRGERLPHDYRRDQFAVPDWRRNNLPPAPRGYRWYCPSARNCVLVRTRTGVITRTHWYDEREDYWRRRYTHRYTYGDDLYYRECRSRPDPAGILIGGLIGGLLGQAADRDDRAGATFAGIIIGGALGAALTRDMDCDDRSNAYYAFYHGLNGGRAGIPYRWRNPHNNHYGEFRVRSYYYDPYGFQCANYRHTVWFERQRRVSGRACRQPDGAWVFLN